MEINQSIPGMKIDVKINKKRYKCEAICVNATIVDVCMYDFIMTKMKASNTFQIISTTALYPFKDKKHVTMIITYVE